LQRALQLQQPCLRHQTAVLLCLCGGVVTVERGSCAEALRDHSSVSSSCCCVACLRWELQRNSSSINGSRCCRQLVVGPCLHLSAIPDLLKPFFQRLLLLCRVSAALVNGMSVRECIVVLHVARVGNRRLRFCDCCSRYFCTCSVHTAVFAGVGGVHRSAVLAEHTGCSSPVSHFGTCPSLSQQHWPTLCAGACCTAFV